MKRKKVNHKRLRRPKSRFRACVWSVFKACLALWALSILWVVALKWVPVYYTPLMLKRSFTSTADVRKTWVPIGEISPSLPLACISAEDNLFAKHNGFSMKAIKQAWQDRKAGKSRRGGSTISQQTAKNVFTFCTRSWARKAIEAHYTFWIEKIWGKRRIMEVYLNVVEWGDGVYGAQAASQLYFGKNAKNLTKGQSALLAAALPCPLKYSVTRPGPYMQKRQQQLLNLMPKMSRMDWLYGDK